MKKVYARARDLNYQHLEVIPKGKRKITLIESNVFHPLYLEVTQPDKLDNEAFNVVIIAPYNYKGARVRSIDLEFLTEFELKRELSNEDKTRSKRFEDSLA